MSGPRLRALIEHHDRRFCHKTTRELAEQFEIGMTEARAILADYSHIVREYPKGVWTFHPHIEFGVAPEGAVVRRKSKSEEREALLTPENLEIMKAARQEAKAETAKEDPFKDLFK